MGCLSGLECFVVPADFWSCLRVAAGLGLVLVVAFTYLFSWCDGYERCESTAVLLSAAGVYPVIWAAMAW